LKSSLDEDIVHPTMGRQRGVVVMTWSQERINKTFEHSLLGVAFVMALVGLDQVGVSLCHVVTSVLGLGL
jgi:hypothetical protein